MITMRERERECNDNNERERECNDNKRSKRERKNAEHACMDNIHI